MTPDQVKTYMRDQRWGRRNAAAYDAYRRLSRRKAWRALLAGQLQGLAPGSRILEVGSGTGFITSILAELGFAVDGIDLSAEMLALAAKNLAADGLDQHVTLACGDAEALDVAEARFDAVVSRWVLWTLPRPARAIAEMARVVKPGGLVVLVDGQHRPQGTWARWRGALVDWAVTGRPLNWRDTQYSRFWGSLPRLDAPEVAAAFTDLGLRVKTVEATLEKQTDGLFYHWLMGGSWTSYLVGAVKPA